MIVAAPSRKLLVFRLSSLGDLVLATAALADLPAGTRVDWVVERRFAELLEGHPRIARLIPFDRGTGFRGWRALLRSLAREGYDEVWDLHRTLRTTLAFFSALGPLGRGPRPRWRHVSKERFRAWGLYAFRKLWPRAWRPTPWVLRYARFAGPAATGRPDFTHWKKAGERGEALAVMPASAWRGKEWPPERFADALATLRLPVLLLGRNEDGASARLRGLLLARGIPFQDAIGKLSLRETAEALSRARAYFGVDTGLSHLAEAVGTPTWVVMGPTSPESGFAPWRPESVAIGADLFCRPCGKDGRACIRPVRRILCLTGLSAERVLSRLPVSGKEKG